MATNFIVFLVMTIVCNLHITRLIYLYVANERVIYLI